LINIIGRWSWHIGKNRILTQVHNHPLAAGHKKPPTLKTGVICIKIYRGKDSMIQTNQLIILGGPASVGKSFLFDKIRKGECPLLSEQLGITTPSEWDYIAAKGIEDKRYSHIEKLIIHFDFDGRYSRNNGFDSLHGVINNSQNAVIETLLAPPKIIVQRMVKRIIRSLPSLFSANHIRRIQREKLRNKLRKLKKYINGYSLQSSYDEWFKSLDNCSIRSHLLLDSRKPDIMLTHPYSCGIEETKSPRAKYLKMINKELQTRGKGV
jgi:hypothetical protein